MKLSEAFERAITALEHHATELTIVREELRFRGKMKSVVQAEELIKKDEAAMEEIRKFMGCTTKWLSTSGRIRL